MIRQGGKPPRSALGGLLGFTAWPSISDTCVGGASRDVMRSRRRWCALFPLVVVGGVCGATEERGEMSFAGRAISMRLEGLDGWTAGGSRMQMQLAAGQSVVGAGGCCLGGGMSAAQRLASLGRNLVFVIGVTQGNGARRCGDPWLLPLALARGQLPILKLSAGGSYLSSLLIANLHHLQHDTHCGIVTRRQYFDLFAQVVLELEDFS